MMENPAKITANVRPHEFPSTRKDNPATNPKIRKSAWGNIGRVLSSASSFSAARHARMTGTRTFQAIFSAKSEEKA